MANAAARRTLKREVPLEIGPHACIENFNPVLYLAVCRLDEPVHPHRLRRRFKEPGFYPGKSTPSHMSEGEGRFVKGRWVTDPAPVPESEPESAPVAPTVEEHLHEASQSVKKAVDDVVSAGQHLLGTPEGHEHIQQAAKKAAEDLERAINSWAESARQALQRRRGSS